MTIRSTLCLALVAGTLALLPEPASAQALLPPYEITTSVRSMGLEPISRPVRHGARRYILRAIDSRGAEVAVTADAFSGRVLFVRPVAYPMPGPAYAERYYPRGYYPGEVTPPRGVYEGPPARLGEPSVIYAPRGNSAGPRPPARIPSVNKPSAPKVAAKPSREAKPAAAPQAEPSEPATSEGPAATTGAVPEPALETPALAVPPVQSLE